MPPVDGVGLARLLADFSGEIDRVRSLSRLGDSLKGPLNTVSADLAAELRVQGQVARLKRFAAAGRLERRGFLREDLRVATSSALWTLARLEGEIGDTALDALGVGAVRVGGGPAAFRADLFGLGAAIGAGGRASYTEIVRSARVAAERGGIPPSTPLSAGLRRRIASRLRHWEILGPEIPPEIVWTPHPTIRGLATGVPLWEDPESDGLATPIFLAPGLEMPPHLHGGPGGVIFLSGMLVNGRRTFQKTRDDLFPAGTVHALRAGGAGPAIFISVTRGGVFPIDLPRDRGRELLRRFGIGREMLVNFLDGVPHYSGMERPKERLVNLLFRFLDWLDLTSRSRRAGREEAVQFLTLVSAADGAGRLGAARRLLRGTQHRRSPAI